MKKKNKQEHIYMCIYIYMHIFVYLYEHRYTNKVIQMEDATHIHILKRLGWPPPL